MFIQVSVYKKKPLSPTLVLCVSTERGLVVILSDAQKFVAPVAVERGGEG
jgi:hypothetical protein